VVLLRWNHTATNVCHICDKRSHQPVGNAALSGLCRLTGWSATALQKRQQGHPVAPECGAVRLRQFRGALEKC